MSQNVAWPVKIERPAWSWRPGQKTGSVSPPGGIGLSRLERRSLAGADLAMAAAFAALAIGFAAPRTCTVIQIFLMAGFIMHGSAAWLPAILMLLFTPTDFKAGGADLLWEKFEGVTVYVLGFPLTASYSIVGAVLIRGLLEVATMPRVLAAAFSRWWLLPIAAASSICVYAGLQALDQRMPGWSSSARATLSLVTLWYGVSLCRDWSLLKEVVMRRLGPLCGVIVTTMFFVPLMGILISVYLSCAAAWSATVLLGVGGREYARFKPLALFFMIVCVAVPACGFRVSSAVAAVAFAKMGNTNQTTMTVLITVTALAMGAVQPLCLRPKGKLTAWLVATILFVSYVALPFVVAEYSREKEFGTDKNVGTLRERVTYKLFVERPAIWRGTIEVLKEPPYVIVPPNRSGGMITAGGQRLAFKFSSHNVVLDYFRSQGFVSGSVSLTLLYVGFVSAVTAFLTVRDPVALISAAVFVCGAMLNGLAAGHILETGPGFMLWTFAGICLGAVQVARLADASRESGLRQATDLPRRDDVAHLGTVA